MRTVTTPTVISIEPSSEAGAGRGEGGFATCASTWTGANVICTPRSAVQSTSGFAQDVDV